MFGIKTSKSQSPASNKQLNFYDALKSVMGGKKVTKSEWNNKEVYGVLDEARLKLHKLDGKLYDWILSDVDILGSDYIILTD